MVELLRNFCAELFTLRGVNPAGIGFGNFPNLLYLRCTVDLLQTHIFAFRETVDHRLQLRTHRGFIRSFIILVFSCCVNAFRVRPRGRARGIVRPEKRRFQSLLQTGKTLLRLLGRLAAVKEFRFAAAANLADSAQGLGQQTRFDSGQTFQRVLILEHVAHPVRRDLLPDVCLGHRSGRLLRCLSALLDQIALVCGGLFCNQIVDVLNLILHDLAKRAALRHRLKRADDRIGKLRVGLCTGVYQLMPDGPHNRSLRVQSALVEVNHAVGHHRPRAAEIRAVVHHVLHAEVFQRGFHIASRPLLFLRDSAASRILGLSRSRFGVQCECLRRFGRKPTQIRFGVCLCAGLAHE